MIESQFQENTLTEYLCPLSLDFPLYGDQNSNNFSYLEIQVKECSNSSVITCASQTFKNNYLQNQPHIEFKAFFLNTVVDISNFSNPVSYFLEDATWFISNSENFNVFSELGIRATTISSSDNYFGFGVSQISTVATYQDDREDRYFMTTAPTPSAWINIRPANYVNIIDRTYMTISSVLSSVGGIWNLFFLIFGFVAGVVNKRRFAVELAREIMGLDLSHHYKKSHDKPHPNPGKASPSFKRQRTVSNLGIKKDIEALHLQGDFELELVRNSLKEETLKKVMAHVRKETELTSILTRLKKVEEVKQENQEQILDKKSFVMKSNEEDISFKKETHTANSSINQDSKIQDLTSLNIELFQKLPVTHQNRDNHEDKEGFLGKTVDPFKNLKFYISEGPIDDNNNIVLRSPHNDFIQSVKSKDSGMAAPKLVDNEAVLVHDD
jgi:hypothetical protein